MTSRTGNIDTPFGYGGQHGYVYDKETGLYFLKSRYYDPATGRFTTRDRFKGFENRPASQNAYTYTENDPVNRIDSDGFYSRYTHLRLAWSDLMSIIRTATRLSVWWYGTRAIVLRILAWTALGQLVLQQYWELIATIAAILVVAQGIWYIWDLTRDMLFNIRNVIWNRD